MNAILSGDVSAADLGTEVTQTGCKFCPQGLESALRRVAGLSLPLLVTENGIATADDSRRSELIRLALAGVEHMLTDGTDVRGYFHWSALDNLGWMLGCRPAFGLIAVDRATWHRTAKDSATRQRAGVTSGRAGACRRAGQALCWELPTSRPGRHSRWTRRP